MHLGFLIGLQRLAGFTYEELQPEEIDYYLNRATTEFIKENLFGANDNPSLVQENLRTLITEEEITLTPDTAITGRYTGSLPSSYYFYLDGTIKDDEGTIYRTNNVSIETLNDFYSVREDKPTFRYPPIAIVSQTIYTVTDRKGGDFQTILLEYVRTPATIDIVSSPPVSSDLPVHTHYLIVDLATQLAVADIRKLQQ